MKRIHPEVGHLVALRSAVLGLFALWGSAVAWSPETHVWVGEQVLSDVLDDGQVTIGEKAYALRPEVVSALRNHPEAYRAGHLGPDAFPDALVGQTTAHPGINGGWQADEFLRHLLVRADTTGNPAALSFAHGYLGHAAADVFAHTYVNRYAGDVFNLKDESTVELRHFTLEKYIGQFTPAMSRDSASFSIPTEFVRDILIKDPQILAQYRKLPYASHLTGAVALQDAVHRLKIEAARIDALLGNVAAFYLKELVLDQGTLEMNRKSLKLAEDALAVLAKESEWTQQKIREAQKELDDLAEQLRVNEQWLLDYPGLNGARKAALGAAQQIERDLQRELGNLQEQLITKRNEALSLPVTVTNRICKTVFDWIPFVGDIAKQICDVVEVFTDVYSDALRVISS